MNRLKLAGGVIGKALIANVIFYLAVYTLVVLLGTLSNIISKFEIDL